MYGDVLKLMFYQYDKFNSVIGEEEMEGLRREYKLIQAKKSKMSSVGRKEVCRVYEKILTNNQDMKGALKIFSEERIVN